MEDGKYRIFQWYSTHKNKKENVAFLKNEYGIGGAYPATGWIDEWHDAKGIRISRGIIGNEEISILMK